MKIIFLDFDGVLITWRSHWNRVDWNVRKMDEADPVVGHFLERLCHYSQGDVKIVISSSWRHGEEQCRAVLDKFHLQQYLHEDWCTITYVKQITETSPIVQGMLRGGEIQEWLDRHPDIKDYRILDDDTNILMRQQPSWVNCDGVNGLSGQQMRRLVEWALPKKFWG